MWPGRWRATSSSTPWLRTSILDLEPQASTTQGIAEAVFSPDRVNPGFIERLLSKCADHLSLLAAPATLDRIYGFSPEAFDGIFDAPRATVPCIVLDVPHQWSGWTRRALAGADK